MHIVVVGAGISGAVTALTLASEGCTVDIIDGAPTAATGASFANAGLVSPGHCFSWAEPGVAGVALKSLLGLGDGISICPPWTPSLLRWGALFAREGTRDRWLANSTAALDLAAYSRDMQFGASVIPFDAYGGRQAGILYLYGENDQPSAYDEALLKAAGEPFECLDQRQMLTCEPILNTATVKFARAVFCRNDGTGDAGRYAAAALEQASGLGAKVHLGEKVLRLATTGNAVVGVETDHAHYKADAVVVAAGLSSRQLPRPHGLLPSDLSSHGLLDLISRCQVIASLRGCCFDSPQGRVGFLWRRDRAVHWLRRHRSSWSGQDKEAVPGVGSVCPRGVLRDSKCQPGVKCSKVAPPNLSTKSGKSTT